ncbi:nosip [Symbiodinium sp. CCMP2456]|nr:nosip [Symbiodinium sp. CCMP2456]
MSRHSKHSNDRMFFTAKERADAGYSKTRKEVMGTDCFLPFGFCALTLKAPKDPVATPDGHIFDREAILEYLLQQKLDIQAEQKKFEEQERQREQRLLSADKEVQLKELEAFTNAEQGLLSQDHRHKRALEQADAVREGVPEKKLRRGELLVVDKSQLRAKSFWTKEFTPTAAPTEVKKVDATTRCPMTGKKLKVKDLIPVKMDIADQKLMDQGGGKGVYCCAVSKNAIIHQQALLLKPSGVVILESVWKDIVSKEMKCPVTGKKLRGEEDLLKLERGGSGFSAHNDVEAKSFTMIRSATGDNRTQAGHLPRAGYAGLH